MRRFTLLLAVSAFGFAAVPVQAFASSPQGPSAAASVAPVTMAARVAWAETQAQQFWILRGGSILSSFHTGVSAGQCTEVVATRRPDVIARVDSWAYVQHLLSGDIDKPVVVVNWLAKAWTRDAQQAGIPTGEKPRPNSVMVFQPGAYGAGWAGHVAMVDKVNRDGSFTISEEHAPVLGVVSSRRFGKRVARSMAKDRRIAFIYS